MHCTRNDLGLIHVHLTKPIGPSCMQKLVRMLISVEYEIWLKWVKHLENCKSSVDST